MLFRQVRRGTSQAIKTNLRPKTNFSALGGLHSSYFGLQSGIYGQIRARQSSFRAGKELLKPMSVGADQSYVDKMYSQWVADPNSVDKTWQEHFQSGGAAQTQSSDVQAIIDAIQAAGLTSGAQLDTGSINRCQADGAKLATYIRAFMTHGHMFADLDPLRLDQVYDEQVASKFQTTRYEIKDLLNVEYWGFTKSDLDKEFPIDSSLIDGVLATKKNWTLREIRDVMKKAYCGKIGIEYMHNTDRHHRKWIRERMELFQTMTISNERKKHLLDRIYWTDEFSNFISVKFNTMKRFGLEGCEAFIPGMKSAMDMCVEKGAEKAVIGMPHRGRLNLLANVVRKPLGTIFAEFQGVMPDQDKSKSDNWFNNSGDVKYHLGTSFTKKYPNGTDFTVEVLANPSHLECINPVVMGRVRAENHFRGVGKLEQRNKVVPFLIHGDAAFAGQGVCYESIQMQDLKNYTVGGTIHVIVNNQIGFTTVPSKGRSGMYASDLAKTISAPIIHVNADDIESVHRAFKMAADYRMTFQHDIVVDLIGYRLRGHNELDQPSFTQPLMYKQVDKMTPVARLYERQLIDEGVLTLDECNKMRKNIVDTMEEEYANSKQLHYQAEDWITSQWDKIKIWDKIEAKKSGVEIGRLKEIGKKISVLPTDKGEFHRLVKKIFDLRAKTIEEGKGIDWGTAEALAFATLVQDGYHVRLSGQDVERGTFSHRHAHVFYQDRPGYYNPINEGTKEEQQEERRFMASNSHLSEFAVLGYELGYAQTHPNSLVLWEAQFGDFANGAQVIIDQFISSGEAKWYVKNGLVMLLPHGYDGQGPEHSSARLERYLLLCDQDEFVPFDGETYDNKDILHSINMQVVMPSNAANYFHLLRTHMRLPFRKPLVVIAPKKLLRLKGATSKIQYFDETSRWQMLLKDNNPNLVAGDKIRKVVLCSGQVYYDIEDARAKQGINDVAILRVESLCPFPFKEIIKNLKLYPNAKVTWAQEEPKNAGAWTYAEPRLRNINKFMNRKQTKVDYAGRPIMAATAVGYGSYHTAGLQKLVNKALS